MYRHLCIPILVLSGLFVQIALAQPEGMSTTQPGGPPASEPVPVTKHVFENPYFSHEKLLVTYRLRTTSQQGDLKGKMVEGPMLDTTYTVQLTLRPGVSSDTRLITIRFQRIQIKWDRVSGGSPWGKFDTNAPSDPRLAQEYRPWLEAEFEAEMDIIGRIVGVKGLDEFAIKATPAAAQEQEKARTMWKRTMGDTIVQVLQAPITYLPRELAINDVDTADSSYRDPTAIGSEKSISAKVERKLIGVIPGPNGRIATIAMTSITPSEQTVRTPLGTLQYNLDKGLVERVCVPMEFRSTRARGPGQPDMKIIEGYLMESTMAVPAEITPTR